jgi:putative membrane-bound dehydrogenase-like protein
MSIRLMPLSFAVLLTISVRAWSADLSSPLGIKAPEGFEVSLFAGDELAHDIYSMTIDSHGRIVVAGAGYVKILHDDDKDGKADRATLFSSKPASGAHGMVFVGDDLICTGDNSLMKLRDKDGDGVADGEPEIWAKLKHSEHGANGVVQGPDGWIYVACGNDAGVSASHATLPTSPVKKPEAGAILRFSPDGKNSEIFAHGFRNIYDLDFNAFGQLFTVDSDGERDHHLPWYAPTRLFDVAEGMHHGWVLQGHQRSWNRPAYFPDVAPRLCEIGRGSPTGVVVYRHTQFPEVYRGSVFSCCWTLGKVYQFNLPLNFCRLPHVPRDFLKTTGETGFAPVDLAVGPSGDLFVAVGGRGTRGSVFRIAWTKPAEPPDTQGDHLLTVLRAQQPQAAWSRQVWLAAANRVGREALVGAALDQKRPRAERLQAIEAVTEVFGALTTEEAAPILKNQVDEIVARRSLWSLAQSPHHVEVATLLGRISQNDASYWNLVSRLVAGQDDDATKKLANLNWNWSDSDYGRENSVALHAHLRALAAFRKERARSPVDELWRLHYRGELTTEHFSQAAELFLLAALPVQRLEDIRLMQLSLGDINTREMMADVYAGYATNAGPENLQAIRQQWGQKLAGQFPSFDRKVNLELARLLAMLEVEDEALVDRLTDWFVSSGETGTEGQLHMLIVLSRLPGSRSDAATLRTAKGLLTCFPRGATISRNWPVRVSEVTAELFRRDPKLPTEIVDDIEFGYPWQTLIVNRLPKELKAAGIRARMDLIGDENEMDDPIYRWSEELITEFAELPEEESFEKLRGAWTNIALRGAIVRGLAKVPKFEDREKFLEALSSVQPIVVASAAEALTKLGGEGKAEDLVTAFSALRQNCLTIDNKTTRETMVELLRTWTKQDFEIEEPKEQKKLLAAYKPWFDWLEKEHPAIAKKVAGFGDATAEQWLARLKKVEWQSGDEQRGLAVFQKKACHKCHAGNSPLGPNLAGAAARFSREDLFGSILDPHKEVAPPYQTTQIATSSGKVYSGLIVYESPDATLVQTTPDTTIRIAGDEILSMKKGRVSLMPSGLLNDVSNQDLADLYSYLKTVKNVK